MGADSPLHVYSTAAPAGGSAHYTSHLIFNEGGDIVRINRKPYTHLDTLLDAHRQAFRDALEEVLVTHTSPELVIHESTLPYPGLEIGRLHSDIRERLECRAITVTRHLQNNRNKLLHSLVQQDTATAWYTTTEDTLNPASPVDVYLDGSHRAHEQDDYRSPLSTIGYAIVDGVGRVLAVEARRLDEATESLHAEYLALKNAIDHVNELIPEVEKVRFRTDNNNLGYTFGEGNAPPERFRFISAYIREALNSFEKARVLESSRDKNLFADSLADIAHDRPIHYQPIDRPIDIDAPGYAYTV